VVCIFIEDVGEDECCTWGGLEVVSALILKVLDMMLGT
jgi:hypothetical protein